MAREIDTIYLDYMDITDAYVGDVIEDLVLKHYSDEIDLAEEYGELLEYISRELIRGLFKTRSPSPLFYEKILKHWVSSKASLLRNVVSYLLSKYLENRSIVG